MVWRRLGSLLVATVLVGAPACASDEATVGDVASLGGGGGGGGEGASGVNGDGERDAEGTGELSFEDGLLAYTECMRDEGVDMPDPQFEDPQGGGDAIVTVGRAPTAEALHDEEFQAALEACAPILDEAEQSLDPPTPEQQAEMRDQALAFAECMRAQGIDMPDPTFGEGGSVGIAIPGADAGGSVDVPTAAGPVAAGELAPLEEEFQTAAETCSEEGGPMFAGPVGAGVSGTTEDE